jgi:serine/threonine-protein kinase
MLPREAHLQTLRDQLIGGSLTGTSGVRYFLRALLGEGGQGWVYKANYDEPDGMWVVVKLLRPDSIHQESLVRFQREAEVLRMIGTQAAPSPNVVRFYDHGVTRFQVGEGAYAETVELPFTVLEFVDGITLADMVDATPSEGLAVVRVRRLLRQVVRALETVHAHRIVHRDLKPSNILITSQSDREVAKVTDFGLVKLVDLKLTQTAAIAGATLGYAPPEQYEHGNERVSERTDVFSLSAILFECLAGRAAFPYHDGENPLRVITRILAGPRPSLAECAETLSREIRGQPDLIGRIDAVIGKALQPDPSQRHPSCRTFWSEVEPVLRAAEGRAVERGLIPAGGDGSLPGVTYDDLRDNRLVLGGTDATTLHGPSMQMGRAPAVEAPRLVVLSGPLRGVEVRDALFGGDGSLLAVGPAGFYRWSDRSWSVLPSPPGLDPRWVRGIMRTPDGRSLLFGDAGTVVTLQPDGSLDAWEIGRPDIRVWDAWMERPDEAYLVGECANGRGFAMHVARGREAEAKLIEMPTVLRGIKRTVGGALVACGDGGALLHLQLPGQRSITWERTGHLLAIAAKPAGGLAIVGSGGHALYVSPSLDVLLEPVQTTRDLTAVTVGMDGTMWAVGSDGRVLRHDGTTWVRVSPSTAIPSRLIGVGATATGVVALGDDGTVVEAR